MPTVGVRQFQSEIKPPEYDSHGNIMPFSIYICEDEWWHYHHLHSRYRVLIDENNEKMNTLKNNPKLIYPLDYEQGTCLTYVYWDYYTENSPFKKNLKEFPESDNYHNNFIKISLGFLKSLIESDTFYFVRKFLDEESLLHDDPDAGLEHKQKHLFRGVYDESNPDKSLISLREALKLLRAFE